MNNILRILVTYIHTDNALQGPSSDCRYAKHVICTTHTFHIKKITVTM